MNGIKCIVAIVVKIQEAIAIVVILNHMALVTTPVQIVEFAIATVIVWMMD
jgi:hypothetical protein